MDLDLAQRLAGLSRATYAADPVATLPVAGSVRAEGFVTPCFRGLAVSDERAVYLVFRGTRPGPQESADLKTVLGGWVANLDYRLHDLGVPVRGAVVFSSPRVGDAAFAGTYPVPLVRIERRHDVVPHLPLPPRVAWTLGRMGVDRLLERLDLSGRPPRGAGLELAATRYLHAGELF